MPRFGEQKTMSATHLLGTHSVEFRTAEEQRVYHALANPEWDFRTVTGIADDIDESPETVQSILDARMDFVRRSPLTSDDGESLYTLRSHPVTFKERFVALRQAVLDAVP